ncbi:MAG: molybdenum cofactor biosynthesis protein, partial [Planctomycetota bacterium]
MPKIDETLPFRAVQAAVLTVSSTRTLEDDPSGDTLVARIEGAGHAV